MDAIQTVVCLGVVMVLLLLHEAHNDLKGFRKDPSSSQYTHLDREGEECCTRPRILFQCPCGPDVYLAASLKPRK